VGISFYDCECVTLQDNDDEMALDFLAPYEYKQHQVPRKNAMIVLLKSAASYNHVPKVASDD
jgi:hypothetical protein